MERRRAGCKFERHSPQGIGHPNQPSAPWLGDEKGSGDRSRVGRQCVDNKRHNKSSLGGENIEVYV